MKNKKVGLYNPYLDTLGGGEKHILSILQVLAENGYEIDIFWDRDISAEIKERFDFQFVNKSNFKPNIFKDQSSPMNTFQVLNKFDYFFYVTDGSYFFSSAKKNFVFAMVPKKDLYRQNFLNKLKLWNYHFIANSPFTSRWLSKWNIKSTVVLPYINEQLFSVDNQKKEKVILAVGRFFSNLHRKNHEKIIEAFLKLKRVSKEFSQYKLILAGGLKNEDQSYLNDLKKISKNHPEIIFKTNISKRQLFELYGSSEYFWHFTGLGVDENTNPEKVEHLGITPLEAMSAGCLCFCYKAGGPKELIKDGGNGFLFTTIDDLIKKMVEISNNPILQATIKKNGKKFIKENFSYTKFREQVLKIL